MSAIAGPMTLRTMRPAISGMPSRLWWSTSTRARSRRARSFAARIGRKRWCLIATGAEIDDGNWKLRPAGIGIKAPLQVGKEWRSDANAMHLQSGVAFRASGVAKVVGEERITTPAGTFDTYRVDTMVRLLNTRDQTKSQTWTFVFWYAPSVNRWVKGRRKRATRAVLEIHSIDELTEYSRKP